MIETITIIGLIISALVSFCSLCAMLYAFKKFLSKPRDTAEERITTLEVQMKDVQLSLHQGNDKFRKQDETNEMMFGIFLAFIDFEIAYCHHTGYEHDKDLLRAKELLEKFLAKR